MSRADWSWSSRRSIAKDLTVIGTRTTSAVSLARYWSRLRRVRMKGLTRRSSLADIIVEGYALRSSGAFCQLATNEKIFIRRVKPQPPAAGKKASKKEDTIVR